MPARVLPQSFYRRDTLLVTEELLGKQLCRRLEDGTVLRSRLVEVEAYDGPEDKACHAARGKTPRNAPMFEAGGQWYVYLCYGVHWMLNIVSGPRDYPAAVLVRGVEVVVGPGRLTRQWQIDKTFNTLRASRTVGLWIEDDGWQPSSSQVERTPRIGIDYAQEWVAKPYRWVLNDAK